MAIIDGLLQELEQEAKTTRRVLERVPDNQLSWRPHPKARTLGELALHVAHGPGRGRGCSCRRRLRLRPQTSRIPARKARRSWFRRSIRVSRR